MLAPWVVLVVDTGLALRGAVSGGPALGSTASHALRIMSFTVLLGGAGAALLLISAPHGSHRLPLVLRITFGLVALGGGLLFALIAVTKFLVPSRFVVVALVAFGGASWAAATVARSAVHRVPAQ